MNLRQTRLIFAARWSVFSALALLLVLAVAACASPAPTPTPPPASAPEVTNTAHPISTMLPTATNEPIAATAAPTVPAQMLTPIATGAWIQFQGWSPDGQWLVYSEHGAADPTISPLFPPGRLNFYNVTTKQHCLYPDRFRRILGAGRMAWLKGGRLLVIDDQGKVVTSTPCQEDYQDITRLFPQSLSEVVYANRDHSLLIFSSQKGGWLYDSNAGRMRAIQQVPAGTYDGFSFSPSEKLLAISSMLTGSDTVTNVVDLQTGVVEYRLEWKHLEGEGGLAGPVWLNEKQFVIEATLDRGPLLVTIGPGAEQVAEKLFGISSNVSAEGVELGARVWVAQGGSSFHLVLYSSGAEAHFPPVRLYHSETGQAEVLPFNQLRMTSFGPDGRWQEGFSPDGRWLELYRPRATSNDANQFWLRAVDPPGSQPHLILETRNETFPGWSTDSRYISTSTDDGVSLISVPNGNVVARWQSAKYTTSSPSFSPDGRYLAVQGDIPGIPDEALFLVPLRGSPETP